MSGRSQGVRLRRTWPQRMLIVFNVGCIVAALSAAGALAYARRTTNSIERVVIDKLASTDELASTDPRNFLIVGNDSAAGLDPDDPALKGRGGVEGVRSDTIMIVRVDPKDSRVRILSLPRDLWVEIPGHSPSRINGTLPLGGAELLIETIKADFDIDINHYVEIDFAGFQELVGELGGVPVWFDTPVRDRGGLNVETAGCTTLNAQGALDYVRARHYQIQNAAGKWISDPLSDLGRIQRQQDFIKRLLRRAISQGARNPVQLADFVGIGAGAIKLDQSTTVKDLISLGNALRNFDPDTLKSYQVPVTDSKHGGAEVLDMKKGEAEPILALFRGTGTPETAGTILPATVDVAVINGTGAVDQAKTTSEGLALAGFQMGALAPNTTTLRTEVRFPPGKQAQAQYVARFLDANPMLVPVEATADDDTTITVVTGPDFRSVLGAPRPEGEIELPPSTTTSTTSTIASSSTETSAQLDETTTSGVDEDGVTVTVPSEFVPKAAPAGQSCG